jgi:hypothetical protein
MWDSDWTGLAEETTAVFNFLLRSFPTPLVHINVHGTLSFDRGSGRRETFDGYWTDFVILAVLCVRGRVVVRRRCGRTTFAAVSSLSPLHNGSRRRRSVFDVLAFFSGFEIAFQTLFLADHGC